MLWVDVFHGNVLTSMALMANPVKLASLLSEPRNVFQNGMAGSRIAASGLLTRSAVGGVAGGGTTALLGGDESDIALGTMAGAIWSNAITAAMRGSILTKRYAMTPEGSIHLAYMGFAGWTGAPSDRAIGSIGRALVGLKDRILRSENLSGPTKRLLAHPIDKVIDFDEGFSQTLWETMHNGSKQFYFQTRFNEMYRDLTKAGKLGLEKNMVEGVDLALLEGSREIMQSANLWFGGNNLSALVRDPQFAKMYGNFLLSRDWTQSRLLGAGNMLLNMGVAQSAAASGAAGAAFEYAEHGFDMDEMTTNGFIGGAALGVFLNRWANNVAKRLVTPGDIMAKDARKMWGRAILGMFVMGNLTNRAFTGKWMWENDEGQKLKVVLPGGTALGFKTWLEPFEFIGTEEKRPIFATSRLVQKLNPVFRTAITLSTNRGFFGQPIVTGDMEPWEKAGSLAKVLVNDYTPIIAQGPGRAPFKILSGQDPLEVLGGMVTRLGGLNASNPRFQQDNSSGLQSIANQADRNLGRVARQSGIGADVR